MQKMKLSNECNKAAHILPRLAIVLIFFKGSKVIQWSAAQPHCTHLQSRVEEPAKKRVRDLFYHLCARLARVVVRHHGGESVNVQGVLSTQLVVSASHEL